MRAFVRETSPRRLLFGVGYLSRIDSEVSGLDCRRILVITGGSAGAVGKRAADLLGRRLAGVASRIVQHVPEELASWTVEEAKQLGADGLCSVGGGSATGLAKAVARELDLPIVAVPTTYAGSELTPVWGITGKHKRTGRDSRVVPRVVIYDPEVTLTLSPRVTAASGLNALAHAMSVLLSGSDPVASLHAAEAVRILADALAAAVTDPGDVEARGDVMYGALLAAAALGSGQLHGVHHRLCHALGGTHRLTHAEVHAVLLPHTLAYEYRRDPARLVSVAVILGTNDVAAWTHEFARRLGAPTTLAEIGMPADGLEGAVGRAVDMLGHDGADLRRLLDDAHSGRAPHTRNSEQKGTAP